MAEKIFAILALLSVGYGFTSGTLEEVSVAFFAGAGRGITVVLLIAGTLAISSGILSVLGEAGVISIFARPLEKPLGLLFPSLKGKREAIGAVAGAFLANLLGMANASTPLSLSAVSYMTAGADGAAGDDLILFTALSCSSFALLPTSLLGLRSVSGSTHPAVFLPASWAAGLCGTVLTVGLCKLSARLFCRRPIRLVPQEA